MDLDFSDGFGMKTEEIQYNQTYLKGHPRAGQKLAVNQKSDDDDDDDA